MGFRSTLISEAGAEWPDWFRAKYAEWLTGNEGRTVVLATPWEMKTYYGVGVYLTEDVHRALTETGYFNEASDQSFSMVWLHECGGITKVQVNADGVRMSDPADWRYVHNADGDHNYCYGCSDLKRLGIPTVPEEAEQLV